MKMRTIRRMFAGLMAGAMLVMATSCAGEETSSGSGSTANSGGSSSSAEGNGDSNFNEKGWPIVKEAVTLKVYGSRNSDSLEDWNQYIMLKEMQETTNVNIEWELVESSTYAEKRAIKLGSGDLPDVVKDGLTVTEIVRYGGEGTFLQLDEMQAKYCPNLMAAFDSEYGKSVALKACSTMPDGHRYTFPNSGLAPWIGLNRIGCINTDWLKAVKKEIPTTLDEFKEVLIAFRDQDPNGNGQKDEIPLSWQGAVMGTNGAWDFGLNWLADSFQCPSPQSLVNVKDGKVYFVAATEEYKNFIKWLNELHKEGLLDDTGFTQTGEQYTAKKTAETPVLGVASVWEIGDDFATNEAYNHYAYLDPLTGLNGMTPTPYCTPYDAGCGFWAVTSACKNPEVAVRLGDYFYEDPMRDLQFIEGRMGEKTDEKEQIRQVPCTVCNNGEAYMVGDPPEGVNTQTFRNKCCPSSQVPFYIPTEAYEKYQHLHYTDLKAEKIRNLRAAENTDLEVLPTLLYTDEESEIIAETQASLITEANRIAAEWVANGKIDEEWDSYINTLNSIGMDRMITTMQAAYDRFLAAK